MTEAAKRRVRVVWPYLLVGVLALLSIGTITNQLKINAANSRLAMQASNGQKALVRTCKLVPIAQKIYADNLKRGVITIDDFTVAQASATQACGSRP